MNKKCNADDCNKTDIHAKNFCFKHYQRLRKHGDVNYKSLRFVSRTGICSIDKCNAKHYMKGYCQKHWDRYRKHGDANYQQPILICNINKCKTKHYAKGYCAKHLRRYRKYGNANYILHTGRYLSNQCGRKYWKVKSRCHPNKAINDYIFEHRLIMEVHLGRFLMGGEVVHHKDGNTMNNNINNLQLMTNAEHSRLHNNLGK